MTKPTPDELRDLFANLAEDVLKNGKAVIDHDTGELVRETPPAALLAVLRQFIRDYYVMNPKDNAVAGHSILKDMPDLEDLTSGYQN